MSKYQKKGDYEIGYGKPPKATQIGKGVVLNPNGSRGKQGAAAKKSSAQMLAEQLADWSNTLVTAQKGGKEVRMKRMQVLIERLGQMAMQGNIAAMKVFMAQVEASPALIDFVRPAGVIVIEGIGDEDSIRRLRPKDILRALPDMSDEDLAAVQRVWKMPDGQPIDRRDVYIGMHPKEQVRLFEKFGLK